MLNLTRREKNVIIVLVFLYIAGSAIFFGKKIFIENNYQVADKEVIESEFRELAEKVDSTYFVTDKVESEKVISKFSVNINIATKEDLITIKGIGPATADKIIEYRKINGNFSSINELTKIHGIGEKTLEKIKGEVTIE